jgi:hypothetical protein
LTLFPQSVTAADSAAKIRHNLPQFDLPNVAASQQFYYFEGFLAGLIVTLQNKHLSRADGYRRGQRDLVVLAAVR